MVVGLSTWFREDLDDTPDEDHDSPPGRRASGKRPSTRIERRPGCCLTCFTSISATSGRWTSGRRSIRRTRPRRSPLGVRWMKKPWASSRAAYPDLTYTFSFTSEYDDWQQQDVSMLDLLELHMWMTHFSDFYKQVGYNYERFDRSATTTWR